MDGQDLLAAAQAPQSAGTPAAAELKATPAAEENQRFADGVAPLSPDGYEYTPPDGFELDQQMFEEFRSDAHQNGLSRKQFNWIMSRVQDYEERVAPQIFERQSRMAAQRAEETLQATWGDSYKPRLDLARRAFAELADPSDEDALEQIGNNPVVIKMLARAGELLQQRGQQGQGGGASAFGSETELKRLTASEAYWDARHPDHKSTVARVKQFFAARYPGKAA